MANPPHRLRNLRHDIDEIDDQIHDLLMRRARVVARVASLKDAGFVQRPAREAEILRRLLARHRGPLPRAVLARMWRELLAGTARMQGDYAVAVCQAQPGAQRLGEVARDHYGSITPVVAVTSPQQGIRAVIEGTAAVAVVPLPGDKDEDPWWPRLMEADPPMPRVIARLPFLQDGGAGAMALAQLDLQPTGDDRTLIGFELSAELSRSSLKRVLGEHDLIAGETWQAAGIGRPAVTFHLVEIRGFLDVDDPRLKAVAKVLGEDCREMIRVGGYATPISAPTSARARPGGKPTP